MIGRRFFHPRSRVYIPFRPGPRWRDEDLINAIRLWAQQYGRPPRWIDWTPSRARARGVTLAPSVEAGHWPTGPQVANRFGGWNKGLERAGVTPRAAHRPKTRNNEEA